MTDRNFKNHTQLQKNIDSQRLPITPSILLLLVSLFLFFSSPAVLSANPVKPGPRDRCPVCGMFVAPYPNWIAQIEFSDGSREFFDGSKDMFRYYLKLQDGAAAHSKENIAGVLVTEYYSTKVVPADNVFFVTGSDVMGPMGKELIPVHTKEAAETFKKEHGGKALFTFEQITSDMLSGH